MNNHQPDGIDGWRLKALIISIVFTIGAYLGFSFWGGWNEVVDAFQKIGLSGTAIALGLSLVNYGLRFGRWQLYLSHLNYAVEPLPSLRIYLSGFALTTTPGKAGEVFRGVLLKRYGVPFSASFAAFVSERLSDLIAIVLLALFGLAHYPEARSLIIAGTIGILLVLVAVSSDRLAELALAKASKHTGKVAVFVNHVVTMLWETRRCQSPKLLLIATVISLVAWGAEALAFYWVLTWLGADVDLSYAVFVYAISMLAGALSFMPGGLGGAEAVMVTLLVLTGMSVPGAAAATVFIRLATLWFAVLIGVVALYRSRHGTPT